MPQKNTIKKYVKNGYYHIYNRGVEKRAIFLDDQDYRVFLHLLKYYLRPDSLDKKHPVLEVSNLHLIRPRPLKNLSSEIDLLCYCLMPNHFHLLIQQKTIDGIQTLMRKIGTSYSMYFNKRYDRVGHLFQGTYKAALIETDEYLLHLSRYIHLNPRELTGINPVNYSYSSYKNYLGIKHSNWLKPNFILNFFNKESSLPYLKTFPSYQKFVEGYNKNSEELLGQLTLE